MSGLAQLKQDLARRFPDAAPLPAGLLGAVGTGIGALDALLPNGGLARGRVTLWRPGGGATAVLRAALLATAERSERGAWVDVGGTQITGFGAGPLLVRPKDEVEAVVCAEELLRCGGFALVVLAGGGKQVAGAAIRLGRAARAGGSAFALLGVEAGVAHMRIETRIPPEGYRWRLDPFGDPVEPESALIETTASSMGWSGRTRFELPLQLYRVRVGPEQGLVDRRGAPPAVRWKRRNKKLASGRPSP